MHHRLIVLACILLGLTGLIRGQSPEKVGKTTVNLTTWRWVPGGGYVPCIAHILVSRQGDQLPNLAEKGGPEKTSSSKKAGRATAKITVASGGPIFIVLVGAEKKKYVPKVHGLPALAGETQEFGIAMILVEDYDKYQEAYPGVPPIDHAYKEARLFFHPEKMKDKEGANVILASFAESETSNAAVNNKLVQKLNEKIKDAELKDAGKTIDIKQAVVKQLVVWGDPGAIPVKNYQIRAALVPAAKSKLGTDAGCGIRTGWLGNSGEWAIFASSVGGSGLALKKNGPVVVFIPWDQEGPGTPTILEAAPRTDGWFGYIVNDPGYFLIRK